MIDIPILRDGERPTKLYLVALKKAIKGDGCSGVPDFYGDCCTTHDLMYRYGITMWGKPCKKRDADNYLRSCMQEASWLHRYSLIAKLYWRGVRLFGAWAYAGDVDERPEFEAYYWSQG